MFGAFSVRCRAKTVRMDLSPFGYGRRRNSVVILGAGATRGASFDGGASILQPPLDADFFAQLRASDLGQTSDGEGLLEFLAEEFGDSDVSMESFYSQVHRLIPPLFGRCIGTSRCKWHDALVDGLDASDVVMSFNYDCVVDASLRDVGLRKWDPENGYGVRAEGDLASWRDHTGTGRFPKEGHRLLKPHGSLNWRVPPGGRLELVADPYAARPDGELAIVPPLWQKSFESYPFHDIWLSARGSLTTTKALLVIGYSLPLTDVYTQAMLRLDVQRLDFLLIANPDSSARARIKRVLRSALRPTTRVVELDSMEEVGRLLKPEAEAESELSAAHVLALA